MTAKTLSKELAELLKETEDAWLLQEGDAGDGLQPHCDKPIYQTMADAAIRLIAEHAAKVAEGAISTETDWDNSAWNQACEQLALRIRSMAEKETGE